MPLVGEVTLGRCPASTVVLHDPVRVAPARADLARRRASVIEDAGSLVRHVRGRCARERADALARRGPAPAGRHRAAGRAPPRGRRGGRTRSSCRRRRRPPARGVRACAPATRSSGSRRPRAAGGGCCATSSRARSCASATPTPRLFEQLDGTHTPPSSIADAERRLGPAGPARLARLLADLGDRGLLGLGTPQARDRRRGRGGRAARAARDGLPGAGGADRARLPPGRLDARHAARRWSSLALLAVGGVGVFAYLVARPLRDAVRRRRRRSGSAASSSSLGRFAVVVVHELAHGLVHGVVRAARRARRVQAAAGLPVRVRRHVAGLVRAAPAADRDQRRRPGGRPRARGGVLARLPAGGRRDACATSASSSRSPPTSAPASTSTRSSTATATTSSSTCCASRTCGAARASSSPAASPARRPRRLAACSRATRCSRSPGRWSRRCSWSRSTLRYRQAFDALGARAGSCGS